MTTTEKNIRIVYNFTGPVVEVETMFEKTFIELIEAGSEELPEELADIFTLKVLVGFNPDGSNRGVIDFA